MNTDTPYNCLYSLIMALWSTIFIEMWKRREAEIANMWRMENYETIKDMEEDERLDFKYEIVIDSRLKGPKKENFTNPYIRRLTDEVPAVIIGFAAIVGCFIGYNTYRKQFKDPANSVGSSLVNAAIIVILGNIYQVLAKLLATWENHRFNEGWESSLSTKNFSFQFVNAYIALFSIAFYERNFNLLAYTLAIILVIKQIFKTTMNVFIKWARVRIRQR